MADPLTVPRGNDETTAPAAEPREEGLDDSCAKGPVVGWRWVAQLRELHRHGLAYETLPDGVRAALAAAAAVERAAAQPGPSEPGLLRAVRGEVANLMRGYVHSERQIGYEVVLRIIDRALAAAASGLADSNRVDPTPELPGVER